MDYVAAKAWHREFRRQTAELLADCNALLMPSTHTTAPATLTTTGTPQFHRPGAWPNCQWSASPAGLPGNGMPAGVQLVGRRDDETKLLRIAAWCEQALGFDALPALWGH